MRLKTYTEEELNETQHLVKLDLHLNSITGVKDVTPKEVYSVQRILPKTVEVTKMSFMPMKVQKSKIGYVNSGTLFCLPGDEIPLAQMYYEAMHKFVEKEITKMKDKSQIFHKLASFPNIKTKS